MQKHREETHIDTSEEGTVKHVPGISPEEDSDLEATAAGVVLAEDEATAVPWDDADLARLGGGDAAAAAGECGAPAPAEDVDFFRMLSPPPIWPPRLMPRRPLIGSLAAPPIPELSLPLRIIPLEAIV